MVGTPAALPFDREAPLERASVTQGRSLYGLYDPAVVPPAPERVGSNGDKLGLSEEVLKSPTGGGSLTKGDCDAKRSLQEGRRTVGDGHVLSGVGPGASAGRDS